jgi:hypothetical protein
MLHLALHNGVAIRQNAGLEPATQEISRPLRTSGTLMSPSSISLCIAPCGLPISPVRRTV